MKIFRLFLTFILSFVLVSCDSIEKVINGDGRNSAFDVEDEVQEDSGYYVENSSISYDQTGGKSNSSKKSFTVSFYDADESLLDSDTFKYNEQPKYFGPIPKKKGSDNGLESVSYTFIGWSENKYDSSGVSIGKLPGVTKDTDYYAIFVSTSSYKVTFSNEGVELTSSYFKSGDKPTYGGIYPEKDDDTSSDGVLGYAYTFVGWSEDSEADSSQAIKTEDLPPVTKATVYFAIYSYETTKLVLSVSFWVGESNTKNGTVSRGNQPTYNGNPTKQNDYYDNLDTKIEYTFSGWGIDDPNTKPENALKTNDLPPVYKDTTYYAIFSSTTYYKVYFKNENISTKKYDTLTSYYAKSGDTVIYNGNTPTSGTEKIGDDKIIDGAFVGWSENKDDLPDKATVITNFSQPITESKTYYAIFRKTEITFSLSDTSVELDCGSSRTSYNKETTSLKNGTSAVFPKNIEITATLSDDNQYRIEWSIPNEDKNYFSLNTTTGNKVIVTATNPSRLSTLTAKLIKTSDNKTIQIKTCQLRSVMINTWWIENKSWQNNKLCGKDIGDYATGYIARFYNTSYASNKDIVFPSKIKEGSTTKNLCSISGLAKSDGSTNIGDNYVVDCRNIFIPNTVCYINGYSLCYTIPNGSVIFQPGGVQYTYFGACSIGLLRNNKYYDDFAAKLNLNNGTFPYKKYAATSNESAEVTFSNIDSIRTLKEINEVPKSSNTKLFLSKE